MTKLASRSNKLSGVLAYEELPSKGACRKVASTTVVAGMDIGSVVQWDGTSTYVWVGDTEAATLNSDVCIVIDAVLDVAYLTPGVYPLTLLAVGHAGVVDAGLLFKNTLTAPHLAAVYAALSAKNIHISTGV